MKGAVKASAWLPAKKSRRLAAFALIAFILAGLGGLAALAAGGSTGDPLISLGYLTDTFLPQINASVRQRAEGPAKADYDAAEIKLEAAQALLAARAGLLEGDWTYDDLFRRQGCSRGDSLHLTPGSGFLFLEGTASAAAQSGELVDVTGGTSAAEFSALTPGHRYLAGEGAVVTVTVLSDAAYLSSQGYSMHRLSGLSVMPFTDLVSTQWYYGSVRYVYDAGLFNGVTATGFSAGTSMTRAMLAVVLHRLAGQPEPAAPAGFTDVPAGGWYDQAVAWAAGSGVVQGMGQGRYMPDLSITREQMAVMLYRYGAQAGLSMTAQGSLSGFSDGGGCSDWSVEAMTWAVGAGILAGRTDGSLDPAGTATRAEVATMLQRFSALFP